MNIDILENLYRDKKKCLVIGDIMLDKYIIGRLEDRLSETQAPILEHKEEKDILGGAANVAANISNLNTETYLCGIIGKDINGEKVVELLKKENINFIGKIDDKLRTTTKIRCLTDNKQILRIDIEECNLNEDVYNDLLKNINNILEEMDIIILSDYRKGIFKEDFCKKIIKKANEMNKKVIVNSKEKNMSKFKEVTTISLNFDELCETIGGKINNNEKDIVRNASKIIEKYKINSIIVTRSKDGILYVDKDNVYNYKSIARDVKDVSGAGDTVIACFSNFIMRGLNEEKCIEISNIAAGISVEKSGTCKISGNELFVELRKIMD